MVYVGSTPTLAIKKALVQCHKDSLSVRKGDFKMTNTNITKFEKEILKYKITYKWALRNNAYKKNWSINYEFYLGINKKIVKRIFKNSFNTDVEIKILKIEKVSI